MTDAALNQTVTAYLACNGAADAIEFYKRAFGAEERYRIPGPNDTIGHAELFIGNSLIYLADEWPEGNFYSPKTRGGPTASFMIEVPDCDAAIERAIAAGGTAGRPARDEPYGRTGDILDPFGHRWTFLSVNPNFKPEDMMPGGNT
jgi:PhnB protein